jgi:hypothetical protein
MKDFARQCGLSGQEATAEAVDSSGSNGDGALGTAVDQLKTLLPQDTTFSKALRNAQLRRR